TRMPIRNQGQNCLYQGGIPFCCCIALPQGRAHEAAFGTGRYALIINRGYNEGDGHVGALHVFGGQLDIDRHLQQAAGLDGQATGLHFQAELRMALHRQVEGAGLLALVHDLDYVHGFNVAATGFPIQDISVPLYIQSNLGHVAQGEDEHADHDGQRRPVADQARTQETGLLAGHVVFGGIADQAPLVAHLVHDLVTGIDTCGTLDTFELQAVADVDAGGADLYGHGAVDAVTQTQLGGNNPLLTRHPGFAAVVIVGQQHGVFVEHHALEARVDANVETHQFAQPARVDVGRRGEEEQPESRPGVQVKGEQVHHQPADRGE